MSSAEIYVREGGSARIRRALRHSKSADQVLPRWMLGMIEEAE